MAEDVFRENVVIITGASSGIGRALAYQLAKQGAWLALAARDEVRLEAVAESCRQQGGLALAVPTDVSDQAQCEHLVSSTIEKYGTVDTLVNNAGISMWAPFEQMRSLAPFDEIMRTNYLGNVYCTYSALPYLKQRRGRIVVVSSQAGKAGVPTRSGYAASKHAQVGFFDSLRIELAPYGVSITLVCPDFVATEIRERAYGVDGKPLGTSPIQEGKVMTAETCARLIANAAAKRKREKIMGMRGKVGQWVKMIAPGLVDRIASRAITRGR
jgi:short-subunit dehydrogenase